MKRYTYASELGKQAERIADLLWDWQNDVSGDPDLTEALSESDIETLDRAREILYDYARWSDGDLREY